MKPQKGFTLIEVLMSLAIISFLAAGIWMVFSKISLVSAKTSENIKVQRIADSLLISMIEGENWGKEGLLEANRINNIDIVNFEAISFTDKDGIVVRFFLSSDDIYKQVGANPPFNLDSNDLIDVSSLVLSYFDADENAVISPAKVTRVRISLTVQSRARGSNSKFNAVSSVRPRNLISF